MYSSSTICINESHHNNPQAVNTTNTFIYTFPTAQKFTSDDLISLQEIAIYNSFFNIEKSRGNNTFSIIWNANTATTINCTLPDSLLSVQGIDEFIQQQMILNKLYFVASNGDYIIPIKVLTNPSQYKTQINIIAIPTQAQADTLLYTIPSGATWSWAITTAKTPQIILSTPFGSLLGFSAQTVPSAIDSVSVETLSNITPQIATVSNVLISCNLLYSDFAIPENILSSIPVNGSVGSLLFFQNASGTYSSINSGTYNTIVIKFYSQDFQPLVMRDFSINLLLNIRKLRNIK